MVDWQRLVVFSGLGLSALACTQPHVHLEAPESSAAPEQRVEAYGQLRPLSMQQTHTTVLRNGAPVDAFRTTDYLQLKDGRRVYHAEDLLPVVPADSPTATAAAEAESKLSTASTLQIAGWSVFFGGTAVMLSPFVLPRESGEDFNMTPVYIGGGIMLLAAIPVLMATGYARTAQDEKATAFTTYDESLRRRLNLCERNGQVVPCQ